MKHRLTFIFAFCLFLFIPSLSQERVDSDSIIKSQQSIIQETKLREAMLIDQMSRLGESSRKEALKIMRSKAIIDSMRNTTPGSPLIVNGDTLLKIYSKKGGMLADQRVENAQKIIVRYGKSLTLFSDSCYVYEGEYFSDIMIGNDDEAAVSLTSNGVKMRSYNGNEFYLIPGNGDFTTRWTGYYYYAISLCTFDSCTRRSRKMVLSR